MCDQANKATSCFNTVSYNNPPHSKGNVLTLCFTVRGKLNGSTPTTLVDKLEDTSYIGGQDKVRYKNYLFVPLCFTEIRKTLYSYAKWHNTIITWRNSTCSIIMWIIHHVADAKAMKMPMGCIWLYIFVLVLTNVQLIINWQPTTEHGNIYIRRCCNP